MTAIDQVARIRDLQSGAARPIATASNFAAAAQSSAGVTAFVLETKGATTADALRRGLENELGAIRFELEPLFDEGAPCFFRVVFPNASFADLGGSPFEIGYHLEDRLELASAEPDLQTDFFPWLPTQSVGDEPELNAAGFSCFDDPDGGADNDAWALAAIDTETAWKMSRGGGILIAHIDTGLAAHTDLENADVRWPGINLVEPQSAAVDPLDQGLTLQPGHGTATSSVIISKGGVANGKTTPPGVITGVAPDATLLPIRAIRSVLRLNQSRVAKAVHAARVNGAHIITMSLGGLPMRALQRAIDDAVAANIIVLAAAGNCVGLVVYPAAYQNCLAVAAVGPGLIPWRGSSRGPQVDVSAPGAQVPHAVRAPGSTSVVDVKRGQGTSFAVAMTAGVAALWLAHVDRAKAINNLSPSETLQDRFRSVLVSGATTPEHWDRDNFGAGVVNAAKTLSLGLGKPTPPFVVSSAVTSIVASLNLQARAEFQPVRDDKDLSRFATEIAWLLLNKRRAASAISSTPTAISQRSRALQEMLKRRSDIAALI
jgi:hypothetical protein